MGEGTVRVGAARYAGTAQRPTKGELPPAVSQRGPWPVRGGMVVGGGLCRPEQEWSGVILGVGWLRHTKLDPCTYLSGVKGQSSGSMGVGKARRTWGWR